MRGFGRFAIAQSRSTIACRSGASSAVTIFAPDARERDLVRGVVLEEGQADDDQEHRREADVEDAEEDDREDDVEQAEQPAREEHPQREPAVASKDSAFHGANGTPAEHLDRFPRRWSYGFIRVLRGASPCTHRSRRRARRRRARGLRRRRASRRRRRRRSSARCRPPRTSFPIVPAFHLKGDPTKGKPIFASAGCGSCHTLAAAHSTGTIGPNLDSLKPDYRAVTAQVTNGGGAMPAFKSRAHHAADRRRGRLRRRLDRRHGAVELPPRVSGGPSPPSRSISTGR